MGLRTYQRKRDFTKTAEPRGGKSARKRGWSFVVQKHDASHLHYDFRLEMDGVLKSWAVPKGPSLDPSQKRLAIEVEDHPLDYGKFEGTIPEGEYGGGTVMLWDRGTWEAVGDAEEDYREGKLKFFLHGEKLSGGWMLVRSSRQTGSKPQWLLIKERDEAARSIDDFDVQEAEPLSVKTGRDLDEIAAGVKSRGKAASSVKRTAKSSKSGKSSHAAASKTTKAKGKSKRSALPDLIEPQLATLVDAAPAGDQWMHEIKFDGYRIVAYVEGHHAKLMSRNALDWTVKFPEVAAAAAELNVHSAVFDGEVVVLDEHGASDFQALQNALRERRRERLVYYVFDLLWLDGEDLRSLPLSQRKEHLSALKISTKRGRLRMADHITGHGAEFFAEAERMGLEGIISKRAERPYVSGRSRDWLKVKCAQNGEFVIVGFTDPSGSRHGFGALLLGYYEKDKLVYAGRVGTGFDDKALASMARRLKGLETDESPIDRGLEKRERGVHWVRPELVGQVRFSNWTRDGLLRHPAFLGLREDKSAKKVHRELPVHLNNNHASKSSAKPKRATKAATEKPVASGKHAAVTIGGVRVTHPDKLLYPDDGITKRQLAEYYLAASKWMLPHIVSRPLSIVRCPDGLGGERFFQKHPTRGILEGLSRVPVKEKGVTADYVYVESPADLVTLVQFGVLELHVWGSRADAIEKPDRVVFDLDPAPEVSWSSVRSAARQIRDFLGELGLHSWLNTSGGKGLHLVVPIARRHEWEFVTDFARAVAEAVTRAAPTQFVATMSKKARTGKIFIDYLRNQRGATAIAPYSTRARAGAPLAMPIRWEELGHIASADQFRLENVARRLAALKQDPWSDMAEAKQSLTAEMLKQLTT